MKAKPLFFAIGLAILLGLSLFSYERTETFEHATTRLSIDGAALATLILAAALFLLCRRMTQMLSTALRHAGLPAQIRMPTACRVVLMAAIPLFLIGYSQSISEHEATRTFGFGTSHLKVWVFLLAAFSVWLGAFLQQLRTLLSHLQAQSSRAAID